jgi:hypothetical protein
MIFADDRLAYEKEVMGVWQNGLGNYRFRNEHAIADLFVALQDLTLTNILAQH